METYQLYQHLIPDVSGVPLAPRIRTPKIVTDKTVRNAMDVWQQNETRYDTLYNRYVGLGWNNVYIKQNFDPTDQPRDRIISNYCHYIVKTLRGYICGNAPEYEYAEDDIYGEAISDYFHHIGMENVDSELIQDMCIYGRAFELVYRDEEGALKSTVISPRDCFVAYTSDVSDKPVFGCIRYAEPQDNHTTKFILKVYTDTDIRTYESYNEDVAYKETEPPIAHGLGRVPIIEYLANREAMSSFEQIMSLESLYNRTMLNRVADKDAFAKSILLVTGQVLGMTPEDVKRARANLNDLRVLQMDSDGSTASFLEHSMDESSVQVLVDQIKSDIHKFSCVPDMSDEQFANNSSGVAMAFKMLGQDEIVKDKILNFQKGYRLRCKIYDYAMNNPSVSPLYEPQTDISAMRIIFKLSIPQDLSYMAQALSTLVQSGILSKDTARQNLTIVADSDIEKEKVDSEADADSERQRMAFEDDFSTTPQNMAENPIFAAQQDDETEE